MIQTSIFDYMQSQKLRDIGVSKVEANSFDWVQQARATALMLAAKNGETSSDDVLRICPKPDHIHPNAVGSVFRDKRFRCVGRMPTQRVSGHAREIKIWSLA